MKQAFKKYTLAGTALYTLGLFIVLFAYKSGVFEVNVMHYYLYAGVLLGFIAYMLSNKFSEQFPIEKLVARDGNVLVAQSASGFINYSSTAIPISQIRAITLAHGYMHIELKNVEQGAKPLEFFSEISKTEQQTHLFKLLNASELNKIQLSLLAE